MIDIGSLLGKIQLDGVDEAKKGLDEVGKSSNSLDSKFSSLISTAKNVVAGLAIGATIKKGWDMATEAVNEFADAGDRIDKSSQKMSMSAESFQRWESIAGHNGSSIEAYGTIMKKLADTTDTNAESFEALGVAVTNSDGTLRSQEDIFYSTIEALAGMEDGTERNRLAQELFGKQYTELLPLINGGTDALKEQWEASKDAVTMTDEQVKSAAAFKDAQQAMQEQIDKVKNTLVENLLPVLVDLMTWVSENLPKIIETCQPVFDFISLSIGFVVNLVKDIINWLVNFYKTNEEVQTFVNNAWEKIKEIFSNTIKIISDTVKDFIEWFKKFWSKYGDDITNTATIIWNGIKIVFETAFNVLKDVFNIFKSLFTGDWEGLWNNVKQLFVDIWEGIKKVFENNLNMVKTIISNKFNEWKAKFDELKTNMISWGRNAIEGFINGIKEKIETVTNTIKGMVNNIKNAITGGLDIHSPSRVTKAYGNYTVEGFVNGINEKKQDVSKSAKDIADKVKEGLDNLSSDIEEMSYNQLNSVSDMLLELENKYKNNAEIVDNIEESLTESIKIRLEKLSEYYDTYSDEQYQIKYEMLLAMKEKYKDHKDSVKEIEKAITELCKSEYDKQKDYLNTAIDDMKDKRKELYDNEVEQTDERLQAILDGYDAELQALEDAEKEKANREKEAKLQKAIADAEDEKEKKQAVEEYNEWLHERELELQKQTIKAKQEQAKELAKQYKEEKKDEYDLEIDALMSFKELEEEKAKVRMENRSLSEEEITKIAQENIDKREQQEQESIDRIKQMFEDTCPYYEEIGEDIGNALLNGFISNKDDFEEYLKSLIPDVQYVSINNSHRTGLNEVPYDGYIAELHKGERILTQAEAQRYDNPQPQVVTNNIDTSKLESRLDKLCNYVENLPRQMQINSNMA